MNLKLVCLLFIFNLQFLIAQEIEGNGTWYNMKTKEMIMIDFDQKEKKVHAVLMAKENKAFSKMKILSQSANIRVGYSENYTQIKIQFIHPDVPTKIYNLYTFDERLGICIYLQVNEEAEYPFYLIDQSHTIYSQKTNNDIAYNLGMLFATRKPLFELSSCIEMDSDYWKKKGIIGKLTFDFKDKFSITFLNENGKKETSVASFDPTSHTLNFQLPTFGKVTCEIFISNSGIILVGKNEKREEIRFRS